MCHKCRRSVALSMPALLTAAAAGFVGEVAKDPNDDIDIDAAEEFAGTLRVLAEIATIAASSVQPNREKIDPIAGRLGLESTAAAERLVKLSWYAGELFQSLAGMACCELEARAIKGDGDAAEFALTGLGREVADKLRAEDAPSVREVGHVVVSIPRPGARPATAAAPKYEH